MFLCLCPNCWQAIGTGKKLMPNIFSTCAFCGKQCYCIALKKTSNNNSNKTNAKKSINNASSTKKSVYKSAYSISDNEYKRIALIVFLHNQKVKSNTKAAQKPKPKQKSKRRLPDLNQDCLDKMDNPFSAPKDESKGIEL